MALAAALRAGKLSVIAGHPGLGKSQLTCAMAAAVTNGGPWPNSEGRAPRGGVLMLSAEDDVADTIRPRLEAAGAAVAHVHVLEAVRTGDGARRGFDLSRDVARLEEALAEVRDVRLVVIDPLTAYLGKIEVGSRGRRARRAGAAARSRCRACAWP